MKKTHRYSIQEIFHSIQGEGFWTGLPVVFVRFNYCNMKCEFCDTDFMSKKQEMTEDEVVETVMRFHKNHYFTAVVLTGGEPLLQVKQSLIDRFNVINISVHIETNGTLNLPYIDFSKVWLTVSPKNNKLPAITKGDELKVLYEDGVNLEQYEKLDFKYFFIQPIEREGKTNWVECYRKLWNMRGKTWMISIQTHKCLNIK